MGRRMKVFGQLQVKENVEMKRTVVRVLSGLVLLGGIATNSSAQVKRVEMHMAGYLCGN
jgi:hypothetical protein